MLTRGQGLFLVAAGLFNLLIWPRFALAISRDARAWTGDRWDSAPTAFFWVHAVLITLATFFALGTLFVAWRAHVTAH